MPVGFLLPLLAAASLGPAQVIRARPKPSVALPPMQLTRMASLLDHLFAPVRNAKPLAFYQLKQKYGFVLYRTTVAGRGEKALKIRDLRN